MATQSWTSGYFAEVDYTFGYYRELSPLMIDCALLARQLRRPGSYWAPTSAEALARTRYLELGIGQGLSLNIHAAANPGEYWGTDFMPSQASFAAGLAEAAGSNAVVLDESFEALAERQDLPKFDLITLHGIWSWIGTPQQDAILAIIRNRLNPGGAVYLSYNCMPGWAPTHPLRHVMSEFSHANSHLPTQERISAAVAFAETIAKAGARFFAANPAAQGRLDSLKGKDPNYLAHEYFNLAWTPTYFSAIAAQLQAAKLDYGASAHLPAHFDNINLSQDGQALLAGIPSTVLRETTRDLLLNEAFRRDIWTKGVRPLPAREAASVAGRARIVLATPSQHIKLEAKGALGTAQLAERVYKPMIGIIEDLSQGEGVEARAVVQAALQHGVTPNEALEAIKMLIAIGAAAPAHDPAVADQVAGRCERLNAALCADAVLSDRANVLASPVAGAGIGVPRIHRLFIRAAKAGATNQSEMVGTVARELVGAEAWMHKNGELPTISDTLTASLTQDLTGFRSCEKLYRALRLL